MDRIQAEIDRLEPDTEQNGNGKNERENLVQNVIDFVRCCELETLQEVAEEVGCNSTFEASKKIRGFNGKKGQARRK